MIPLPIGFLLSTDRSIIALVDACDMKSKWGVWPLITHPRAKKASNFLIFFEIVTGISNTPGTRTILTILDFGIKFKLLLTTGLIPAGFLAFILNATLPRK